MKEIYLDGAATTRVGAEVSREVQKYLSLEYGNPSSLYSLGEKARKAIDQARKKIASEINAKPEEIIFTSCATESNNIALGCLNHKKDKNKIIISSIEHPSIWEVAIYLESQGYDIVKIPVSKEGLIDINFLEKEIDSKTLLVSVMHVNNVFGSIQNLDKIGYMCKRKGVLFHTDATQSFGKLKIDVKKAGISMLSASGHKIGAPKGIGFLYVKSGVELKPILFGGGQERGLRSGTENVSGIMGFSKALEVQRKTNIKKIEELRDYFVFGLENLGGKINGTKEDRIYNNIHVTFPGISGESLVYWLSKKGIYVSAGSACDSKKEKEDHILKAIGLTEKEVKGSIRITLDEYITKKEIDYVVKEIERALHVLKLR